MLCPVTVYVLKVTTDTVLTCLFGHFLLPMVNLTFKYFSVVAIESDKLSSSFAHKEQQDPALQCEQTCDCACPGKTPSQN